MKPRIPQKINSIEKKERLLETCYYLICENGLSYITSTTICDRAKVSVGTFYAYFKDKNDIIKSSLIKFSKPILVPIYSNINLLKFNKNNIIKTLNKMINISLELHTMTKIAHQNIMSVIYSNSEYYEIYRDFLNEEIEIIYQKCIINGFKETNLKETIYTTLTLIDTFIHDKIFRKEKYINYEKQRLFLMQTLLRLWNSHI